ncbi:MAG: DUF424 family protein [Candidatus Methanoperedens sp.]|nr:DUF424 family protein [Candidatus Methanoperedens sp.]MCE8424360.1 DUF424 family protein [Candidatus Methanoperedens sp.]MCE8428131.1 DUF424 family protein [Candidatus Methanoperedens sp.]
MYLKKHETEGKVIVAVCDKAILGKEFREGKLVLRLDERFYKGDEACEDTVKEALICAAIANVSGERSVACAIACECIDPDAIIYIEGIPHAQMVRL